MKRFNVVIPKDDGGIEVYPMKQWLRDHPDELPGWDPTSSTSHQLRNALKKKGWRVKETEAEVRMMTPGGRSVDSLLGDNGDDIDDGESEAAFALEYQLRDFLAQNLHAIPVEAKTLHLYVDSTGKDGIEYATDVGPIDILAVDDTGAFVVFELKRGRSPDHAIGQLSRYMGWVKLTIGKGQPVRGVIVAKTISKNLRYAVTVVPDVSLFEYEISFALKAIDGAQH